MKVTITLVERGKKPLWLWILSTLASSFTLGSPALAPELCTKLNSSSSNWKITKSQTKVTSVSFSTADLATSDSAFVNSICVPANKGLVTQRRITSAILNSGYRILKTPNWERNQDPYPTTKPKPMIFTFSQELVQYHFLLQTVCLFVLFWAQVNKMSLILNTQYILAFLAVSCNKILPNSSTSVL